MQTSIILGSLLGDGHISKPRKQSHFVKGQTFKRKEYLDWHYEKLMPMSSSVNFGTTTIKGIDKIYKRYSFITKQSVVWTELRNKWYPKGVKIVPKDLVLDPLMIAIWFCDDGSNSVKKRYVSFATYSFTKKEVKFLAVQFKTFGIVANVQKNKTIKITGKSYDKFVEFIKPYIIWDCFKYKIKHRFSKINYLSDEQAIDIVEKYKAGMAYEKIAKIHNTDTTAVSNVIKGKTKKHLNIAISKSKLDIRNKSGITGLRWDKIREKWTFSKQINGKTHTKRFENFEDAKKYIDSY